jgi:hypothetical protein
MKMVDEKGLDFEAVRRLAAIEILKIAKKCNLIYCSDKKCPMCVPFKNEMKKKFGVE